MASAQAKLTPLQQAEADRKAAEEARSNKVQKTYSDEEKATRKERVALEVEQDRTGPIVRNPARSARRACG